VLETRRYILGGSWGEPTYMFSDPDSQSPWERKATFGFRCVLYFQGGESVPDALFAPAVRRIRDFADVSPISDELFESWLRDWYSFVRAEPKAVLATVDENSLHWRKEKIRFDAAYGGEEIVAYLFLPKGVSPPYQPVIYFPGIGATWPDSSETLADFQPLSFVIKSGRAVLYPVYKGTYERKFGNPPTSDKTGTRDWVIQLSKDLRRSVDYLWTRRDIDTEKLTYYGFSWGAVLGPVMVAIEDRIQFAVFLDGGFWINHEVLPSVDAVSFAPRVKVPVLMVNGREDFTFPYKSSQEPMYRLLGSDDKEHSLHPGGHGLFGLFTTRIKDDVLKWLDDHLGTVQ
jgi:dienelactone hydrolase